MKFLYIALIFPQFLSLILPNKTPIYFRKSPMKVVVTDQPPDQSLQSLDNAPPTCPCLQEVRKCPPCNPYEFTKSQTNCPCAPRQSCPPCILAKTQKFVHEQAEKEVDKFSKFIFLFYRTILKGV